MHRLPAGLRELTILVTAVHHERDPDIPYRDLAQALESMAGQVAKLPAALEEHQCGTQLRCGRRGRAPLTVALAGPPGSAALMSAPDVTPGYLSLVPNTSSHHNEVAARVALHIPLHRPGRYAADVRCPILFTVCETDTVAPAKATLRHARKAPRHEIHLYPAGHFEIYLGEPFERIVGDQLAFLQHYVPTV